MVNKNQLLRRLAALACLLLLCAGLAGGQLVQLQLVNGEDYVRQSAYWLTTTSTVSAARGEILDRYGRPMVTNKTEFSLVLVYSAWEQEGHTSPRRASSGRSAAQPRPGMADVQGAVAGGNPYAPNAFKAMTPGGKTPRHKNRTRS